MWRSAEPAPAPAPGAPGSRPPQPGARRCGGCLACRVASAIPRFAKRLAAIDADAARSRQQAVDRSPPIALLDPGTQLDHVALAQFEDGQACGDALLDLIES